MTTIRIALIGDYNPAVTAHQAIPKALELASQASENQIECSWVGTDTIPQAASESLSIYDALWCVPASPYASLEGALRAIRFARETGRPFLGTCGGFQHAVLEYARNVLGIIMADHAESNPETEMPLIAPLECALVEKSGRIMLEKGSRLENIYGKSEIEETYHCSYGLNPQFEEKFSRAELIISGRDENRDARAVELTSHPFFICTLFQPERSALQGKTHPLISACARAAKPNKRIAA